MSRVSIVVSFALEMEYDKLDEFLAEQKLSREDWESEAVPLLRQDMEEVLPASDWLPFERSHFQIAMYEVQSRPDDGVLLPNLLDEES